MTGRRQLALEATIANLYHFLYIQAWRAIRQPTTELPRPAGRFRPNPAANEERRPPLSKREDIDWTAAEVSEPVAKKAISIRIDEDVLAFFKADSDRYQSKINAVLRAYMVHQQRLKKPNSKRASG